MTPDAIAGVILSAIPQFRNDWRYEAAEGTPLVLKFWPTGSVGFLNIGDVIACFQREYLQVTWQNSPSALRDSPCIVIQGGVRGTLVQAVFVLKGAE
jgi:hypothetical protein